MKIFLRVWCLGWLSLAGVACGARAASVSEAVPAGAGPAAIVLVNAGPVESAVSVRVPADFLALTISVISDASTATERLELLSEAENLLRSAATKAGLDLRAQSTFQAGVNYGKTSSSVGAYLGFGGEAGAPYVLLARLDDRREDLFKTARRLHGVLDEVKLPKKVSLRAADLKLALADAEARRDQVRAKIGEHLKKDQELVLGRAEPAPRLSGLDGPLRVSPAGERELALWLPFRANWGEASGSDK